MILFIDMIEVSVENRLSKGKILSDEMVAREDNEVNKLPPGDPCRLQTNGPISSLNEAWFHVLDRCVINLPLSEVIPSTCAGLLFCRRDICGTPAAERSWR